jgi:hypothetical protein
MKKFYPHLRSFRTQVFMACAGMKSCDTTRDGKIYAVSYLHLMSMSKDLGRVVVSQKVSDSFWEAAMQSEFLSAQQFSPVCDRVQSRPSAIKLSQPLAMLFYERRSLVNGVSCQVSFLDDVELGKDRDAEFARLEMPCTTQQVLGLMRQVGQRRSQVA